MIVTSPGRRPSRRRSAPFGGRGLNSRRSTAFGIARTWRSPESSEALDQVMRDGDDELRVLEALDQAPKVLGGARLGERLERRPAMD
jgi:hypothetical protein